MADLKTNFTIGGHVVEPVDGLPDGLPWDTTYKKIEVYRRNIAVQETTCLEGDDFVRLYFTQNEYVLLTMDVSAGCGNNIGYIHEIRFGREIR